MLGGTSHRDKILAYFRHVWNWTHFRIKRIFSCTKSPIIKILRSWVILIMVRWYFYIEIDLYLQDTITKFATKHIYLLFRIQYGMRLIHPAGHLRLIHSAGHWDPHGNGEVSRPATYSTIIYYGISHRIGTTFCFALLCCDYIISSWQTCNWLSHKVLSHRIYSTFFLFHLLWLYHQHYTVHYRL